MRRGYDRVEGSIGGSYDEIEGVAMSVSRDFQRKKEKRGGSSKRTPSKQFKKLEGEWPTIPTKLCIYSNVYQLRYNEVMLCYF